MELFGFQIKRKKEDEKELPSVVSPKVEDGSIIIDQAVGAGGMYSHSLDLDGVVKSENELIRRYREISLLPEVDSAIEDICNEAIVLDQEDYPVKLMLDDLKVSDGIKKKFNESFVEILTLLEFNKKGYEIFREWYVDGRKFYHILFNESNIKQGIAELRAIDAQKIKKIKKINKQRGDKGVEIVKSIEEFYLYNDRGISENSLQGVKLSLDSVVMCTSGLVDQSNGMIIGYLNKAIKPANQLKMIEDAVVIYRLSRAPERRIFYIDVGNLPKLKAEQYVSDMMAKFKNKLVYDAKTGELADSKKHLSMMEDFWMPRREGGKGTEITTLPGGQNLGELSDVDYFLNKLYKALNVPVSRTKPDSGFGIGRSSEITRDEVKFSKFIDRLRSNFSNLFLDLLRVQLIAKGIVSNDDWKEIKEKIRFDFVKDNHFAELKDSEILMSRLQNLQQVDVFVGKYFSKKWVQKKILQMDDEEIEEQDDEMEEEMGSNPDPELPNIPTGEEDKQK